MGFSMKSLELAKLRSILEPAVRYAAIADQKPELKQWPAVLRLPGRLFFDMVYFAIGPIIRRQHEVNRSLLAAIEYLGESGHLVREFAKDSIGEFGPRSFSVLNHEGSLMLWAERVALYSAVYGLRPRNVLEIGTHKGGSARIISAAMDDYGSKGRIVCVDPTPMIPEASWNALKHRAIVIAERSPEALRSARQAAGEPFDFALIDGHHSYEAVIADTDGTLENLVPGSFILYHDAHNQPVKDGLNHLFEKYAGRLNDIGMMSVPSYRDLSTGEMWGGLRMARYDG